MFPHCIPASLRSERILDGKMLVALFWLYNSLDLDYFLCFP